jgi:crotonobetainyl-CoA:carnitine CoA-transferase CaiB-like acyl-CoA transferase
MNGVIEKQPLSGIKVLDLTRVLAGPLCTQYLGDLGAEIIKVENPLKGDDTRSWGPPFDKKMSAYFLGVNRNKKSITLDFKKPEGLEILKKLLKKSDVVIDNFKPGFWTKVGLDEEWFKKNAKQIVRNSITGYGDLGPQGGRPGYDFLLQAESGLMKITGEPYGNPMKLGVAIVDIVTGLNSVISVLAGLLFKNRNLDSSILTEVNLYNTGIFLLANVASNYLASGEESGRYGNGHPNIVPYNLFQTKEGEIAISVGNDNQFKIFSNLMGYPEWANDEEFKTNENRVINRIKIEALITNALKNNSADFWYEELLKANIPTAIVRSVSNALSNKQTLENEMVKEIQHANGGIFKSVNIPMSLNNKRGLDHPLHPPRLGENSYEILSKILNFSDEDFYKLCQKGVTTDGR